MVFIFRCIVFSAGLLYTITDRAHHASGDIALRTMVGLFISKCEVLVMELKPALTYEQQILRLRNTHNLTIEDEDRAIEILKRVTYYRLTGYGLGQTKPLNKEEYVDGTTLEQIYQLYKFDSAFRNLLIHVIEQIEIKLRAQLANYIALKYGPEGYVDRANFIPKQNKQGDFIHDWLMISFAKEKRRQKNAPFVKHHNDKYEGRFPIWVAVEMFTFGMLSSLYSIMLSEDRKEIAGRYDTKPQYLGSWILALIEVRNICAHYGRLYNMPLKHSPHLYS